MAERLKYPYEHKRDWLAARLKLKAAVEIHILPNGLWSVAALLTNGEWRRGFGGIKTTRRVERAISEVLERVWSDCLDKTVVPRKRKV